ncbi:MAG: iron-sulfur cluster assembly scaffold protein [Sphingomonas bacterium]
MNAPLYNERILRLATEVPDRRLDAPMGVGERKSAVCGSRVTVEVNLRADGRVREIGMQLSACALGQASAALLAGHGVGRSVEELTVARDALAAWLAGEGAMPDWPGIDVFIPALPHHARHAAIRLAFEAAAEAVEAALRAREGD